jgi:outer membrane protein
MGVINVPIYSGGQDSSKVRQAKAALAQSRTALDLARVQTKANVLNGWANFEAARVALAAAVAEVRAAEIALAGVRNEARAGQRTVLDVLNALQEVVNARSRLIQAQHDRVVSGYALLAAIGRLDPRWLGLRVREYRPEINYEIVRDKWGGLRTPAGE